jgi:hypothetical protein
MPHKRNDANRPSSRRQSAASPTGQNMIVGWFSVVTFVSGASRRSLMVGLHRYAPFGAQRSEIAIQIAALNRMTRTVKPNTIRVA